MKQMQFAIAIHASKAKVWSTLWQDASFREWAGIIDPGTYMVGELKEGNEVQYISAENGYGVTSLVEKLVAGEFLLLRHSADTQEVGKRVRKKEWTGGLESYSLVEKNGLTTLKAAFDVPAGMEDYFQIHYPRALERVKILAERTQ